MGRKTHSTKSGGYMNPADQARKLARKRELKKNKKQRGLVRQAVLKTKDPEDIIKTICALDEMEFDYEKTPSLSTKVINEKRIKMRETFFKIMAMYKRENDHENVLRMRRMLENYELKRVTMEDSYAAAKFSAETDPSEIPLPNSMPRFDSVPIFSTITTVPPIQQLQYSASPMLHSNKVGGILKKTRAFDGPGVPVGPPPSIQDIDSGSDDESGQRELKDRKVSFLGADKPRMDSSQWPNHLPTTSSLLHPHLAPPPLPQSRPLIVNPVPLMQGIGRDVFIGPTIPVEQPAPDSYDNSTATQSRGPVIEAQPKLRNIREEVTRFVPVAVRANKGWKYQSSWTGSSGLVSSEPHKVDPNYARLQQQHTTQQRPPTMSKDEIYEQFMAEVSGLL